MLQRTELVGPCPGPTGEAVLARRTVYGQNRLLSSHGAFSGPKFLAIAVACAMP